ncbi:protein of unknown function [Bacillus velezensis UCMB5113]|nr:protein of unknown function [Bacillus velezensis UCMB5113]
MKQKPDSNTNLVSTAIESNLLLLLFHHLNKEKEDNEYNKIIQWILNDAYLQRNL